MSAEQPVQYPQPLSLFFFTIERMAKINRVNKTTQIKIVAKFAVNQDIKIIPS